MATYEELYDLWADSGLRNRVEVAVVVAADAIRQEEPPDASRLLWAKHAFQSPRPAAEAMLKALLATNRALPVEQIQTASDAAIQEAVDNAVCIFADGS